MQCSADYLAHSNATPPPGRILSWTAALVASIVIDAVRALFHLYLGRTADPGGLAAAFQGGSCVFRLGSRFGPWSIAPAAINSSGANKAIRKRILNDICPP